MGGSMPKIARTNASSSLMYRWKSSLRRAVSKRPSVRIRENSKNPAIGGARA